MLGRALISSLICTFSVDGTTLTSIYSSDTTLTQNNSPYYVTGDVTIQSGATLYIENGVEIVFEGDYSFNIAGVLDACYDIDTSNSGDTRGVLFATHTYIHSDENVGGRFGEIVADQDANTVIIKFCNTEFKGLEYSLYFDDWWSGEASYDNCEFNDIDYVFYTNNNDVNVTDSYFHNFYRLIDDDVVVISNSLIEDFTGYVSDDDGRNEFYNNEIIANGNEDCIGIFYGGVIQGNDIKNCDTAITVRYYSGSIKYNNISNSEVGIYISQQNTADEGEIMYNNFMNNDVNIELVSDNDFNNGNLNYWGVNTDNQTLISSKIKDICSGDSAGLYTWWPWYQTPIVDFNNPPSSVTFDEFTCLGGDNHPNLNGNRLNTVYLQNTESTLLQSQSPYYVTSDVSIQSGATLNIENGVEIIFLGDYEISVKGGVINGCYDVDTSNSGDTRGLLFATYTYIHGNYSQMGSFGVYDSIDDGSIKFCNTKFEHLEHGLYYADWWTSTDARYDNCEFDDINYVFDPNNNDINASDSYFHNFYRLIEDDVVVISNSLMEDFSGYISDDDGRNEFYNNEINANGNADCIGVFYEGIIEGNDIKNCETAITVRYFSGSIKYNNISNSEVGIDISQQNAADEGEIMYNNFMNNDINIELESGNDFNNGYLNYWGVNTDNQTLISSTIKDICSGDSTGLYTWWPWYQTPIVDFNNLPSSVTFDEFICLGGNNHPNLNGNRLNTVYLQNTESRLRESQSPYYVTSDVVIQSGATLNIDNGVEIIFLSDYEISVKGGVINGCYDVDTSITDTRGLYFAIFTYIHGNYSRMGHFSAFDNEDTDGSIEFCNTKFEYLEYVMYYSDWWTSTDAKFDNCEFENIEDVFYPNNNDIEVYDSYIHNFDTLINDDDTVIVDNCLIEDFTNYISDDDGRNEFYDNEIIANGNEDCIGIFYGGIIEGNDIKNCQTAINVRYYSGRIKYNNISNCEVGVYITQQSESDEGDIMFNNFINNNISIELNSDTDIDNAYGNYYGISSKNANKIAKSVLDICDSYSNGLVTFWPWSINPVGKNSDIDSLDVYTIDFENCNSYELNATRITFDITETSTEVPDAPDATSPLDTTEKTEETEETEEPPNGGDDDDDGGDIFPGNNSGVGYNSKPEQSILFVTFFIVFVGCFVFV